MNGTAPLPAWPGKVGEAVPGRGLASWLLGRLRRDPMAQARLKVIERISLANKHSLALIEAEGRRFLVATSQEGAASLYPLDSEAGKSRLRHSASPREMRRVW
jgi:flagellar biogenesis protein FliO